MITSGRGGKRAGSGRPAKKGSTKIRTVRLKEKNANWLESEAYRTGRGQGDIVDLAIETLQEHPEKHFPKDNNQNNGQPEQADYEEWRSQNTIGEASHGL